MSDFDSSVIKDGTTENLDQLITTLDSMATLGGTATGSSNNATSSTWVTLVSKTLTVTADEIILLNGTFFFTISDGATGGTGAARFTVDGVQLGFGYTFNSYLSSSAGDKDFRQLTQFATNRSGAVVFALQIQRASGGGTIYSGASEIYVMSQKYRS